MSIAGAYLRSFEPFKDQPLEFKPKASSKLADVHFFVGRNGTGKTRLLSLLASACGNPEELQFRTGSFSSSVVARITENGKEQLRMFLQNRGGVGQSTGLFPQHFLYLKRLTGQTNVGLLKVSDSAAMAFRSIPSLEDKNVSPMGPVQWEKVRLSLDLPITRTKALSFAKHWQI